MDYVRFEPATSAMLKFNTDIGKPMTHHDDAVKVAPDVYKVLLENDEVRVLEARLNRAQNRKCILILEMWHIS